MNASKLLAIFSLGLTTAAYATTPPITDRMLQSIEGAISNVEFEVAPAPTFGLWTHITVEFGVSCDEQFEDFSYSTEFTRDGKFEILASALISKEATPAAFSCAGFYMHKEYILVDGTIQANDISLHFLQPLNATSPDSLIYSTENLEKIAAIDDVKVETVESLCPKGVLCITDGTIVTLSSLMPCVDRLAGISYKTYQNGNKLVIELYGAQVVSALRVRCAEMPVKFQITSIMQFADSVADIEVNLLQ